MGDQQGNGRDALAIAGGAGVGGQCRLGQLGGGPPGLGLAPGTRPVGQRRGRPAIGPVARGPAVDGGAADAEAGGHLLGGLAGAEVQQGQRPVDDAAVIGPLRQAAKVVALGVGERDDGHGRDSEGEHRNRRSRPHGRPGTSGDPLSRAQTIAPSSP